MKTKKNSTRAAIAQSAKGSGTCSHQTNMGSIPGPDRQFGKFNIFFRMKNVLCFTAQF